MNWRERYKSVKFWLWPVATKKQQDKRANLNILRLKLNFNKTILFFQQYISNFIKLHDHLLFTNYILWIDLKNIRFLNLRENIQWIKPTELKNTSSRAHDHILRKITIKCKNHVKKRFIYTVRYITFYPIINDIWQIL